MAPAPFIYRGLGSLPFQQQNVPVNAAGAYEKDVLV